MVSYDTTSLPLFTKEQLAEGEKMSAYDSIDDDVLQSYNEFAMANLVFFALREGSCSELSARMTAMEAASKNAGMWSQQWLGARLLYLQCITLGDTTVLGLIQVNEFENVAWEIAPILSRPQCVKNCGLNANQKPINLTISRL